MVRSASSRDTTKRGASLFRLLSGMTSFMPPLQFTQDDLMSRPSTTKETLQETPCTGSNDFPIHAHIVLTASPRRHGRLETQAFLYQRHEPRGAIPVASRLTVGDLNVHVDGEAMTSPSTLTSY